MDLLSHAASGARLTPADAEALTRVPLFSLAGAAHAVRRTRTDPDTVSLRLREVVTGEIGWRVRGDYRGRICPDDGTAADCAPVNGTFAFEQDGALPDWLAAAAGG